MRGDHLTRLVRNVYAAVSLPCCALSLALWVGSHVGLARAVRLSATPAKASFLVLGSGGVYFVTQEASQATDGSWTAQVGDLGDVTVRFGNTSVASGRFYPGNFGVGLGRPVVFRFVLRAGAGPDAACALTFRPIGLPFWLITVLTAVAPAAWLVGHHRRRRREARPGLCPRCGYDLRATPERCPECGLAT
jgi:hypothetical protein